MNLNSLSIHQFSPISLEEMDKVALLDRMDTKFILNYATLEKVLACVNDDYYCLEVNGKRDNTYVSHYLDTKNFQFYFDHHRGKLNRSKVRVRNYVDSDLFFLEIKEKGKRGRTLKSRIEVSGFGNQDDEISKQFIKDKLLLNQELNVSLKNHFRRITLVNKQLEERVTIDVGLFFQIGEKQHKYDNLVIVEIKQPKVNRNSSMFKALKKYRVYPYRISKYCIGMALLNQDLKQNQFKQKLIKINKIIS